MLPQENVVFNLIPETFKEISDNASNEKELIENINPNIINTTAGLLAKYMYKEPELVGSDLVKTIKQYGLSRVLDDLPGVDTSNISLEFLKSLFLFKGTWLDLLYLAKLAGIELDIYEYGDIIKYGLTDYDYGDSDPYYNMDKRGLLPCHIAIEGSVNIDTFEGVVDLTIAKEILKKIIEKRLYFCTALQYLKLRILMKDKYSFEANDDYKFLITQTWQGWAYWTYGDSHTYGSKEQEAKYGYGIGAYESAKAKITRTISLEYRDDLTYGDPVHNTTYDIDMDVAYGDDNYVYTEEVDL